MELVAASRMRRAQERVLASRPYADKMQDVLADLSSHTLSIGGALHPLLDRHDSGKVCLVLMTSDRGLCGSYNTNMIRQALGFVSSHRAAGDDLTVVAVGRRGRDFMVRYGIALEAEFTGISDRPTILAIAPIVRILTQGYIEGKFRRVHLAYSQFISTMTQRPVLMSMLPIEQHELAGRSGEDKASVMDYIFEPNSAAILNALLPRYVEVQMYQALLESIASEQSARMVAMRNATDNALDIIDHLTLVYNRARQAAITKELIDITTSAAAIG